MHAWSYILIETIYGQTPKAYYTIVDYSYSKTMTDRVDNHLSRLSSSTYDALNSLTHVNKSTHRWYAQGGGERGGLRNYTKYCYIILKKARRFECLNHQFLSSKQSHADSSHLSKLARAQKDPHIIFTIIFETFERFWKKIVHLILTFLRWG